MTSADRCAQCGAIIPEGRQVCPACEGCQHVWVFHRIVEGEIGRYHDYKCQKCGRHRISYPDAKESPATP